MRTLQDVRLNGREFGRDLLAWDALARWLSSQPLPLDLMTLLTEGPAVAVQVEYFLTRIEAARFNGFTPADAVMQVLPEQVPGWLQAADLNNPTIRHWVLGAAAHSAMRDQIRDAIKDGSLTPLDGLTLRPKQAPAAEPVRDVVAGMPKTWTPVRLEELRAYREKHGTKLAAQHFGVSASRVRKLLPSGKLATRGYSAFTHRPK